MSYILESLKKVVLNDKKAVEFIKSLDANKLLELSHEFEARNFWLGKCPHWYENESEQITESLVRMEAIVTERLTLNLAPKELTELGCEVERSSYPYGDTLDFSLQQLTEAGWRVSHQDSSYAATWENENEMKICTYCEGDVTVMKAPNKEVFFKELQAINDWNAVNN